METNKYPTIICPYLFYPETVNLRNSLHWELEYLMEEDVGRIGSDMMYQRLWKKCSGDVFIMHSDMLPLKDRPNWHNELMNYVNKFPEAGMFGCKLLYPEVNQETKNYYIQCAGGKFVNDHPKHFGSGLDLFTGETFQELEEDTGQYDHVREVAWTTFGGLYIRRKVLDEVGDFDPDFEWTYNRDVDYCLQTREKGWKIYQIPVPLLHFESKDNKRIRNQQTVDAEQRNLNRLKAKWAGHELYKTINNIVE